MTYELEFHPDALKEWYRLLKNVREQFKKVLERRLRNPHVNKARLHGALKNYYKIKLLKAGYRLAYEVNDNVLIIAIIAVGKRANNFVYDIAKKR